MDEINNIHRARGEKHKLDQTAARNIRMSLVIRVHSFLEVKSYAQGQI